MLSWTGMSMTQPVAQQLWIHCNHPCRSLPCLRSRNWHAISCPGSGALFWSVGKNQVFIFRSRFWQTGEPLLVIFRIIPPWPTSAPLCWFSWCPRPEDWGTEKIRCQRCASPYLCSSTYCILALQSANLFSLVASYSFPVQNWRAANWR